MERGGEPGNLAQTRKQLFHSLLVISAERMPRRARGAWRREALPLGELFAKLAFQREQPFGKRQPVRQSVGAWRRQAAAVRPCGQGMIGLVDPQIAAGVARQ